MKALGNSSDLPLATPGWISMVHKSDSQVILQITVSELLFPKGVL